ncbi:MAG: hypothetical protein JW947_07085 [Sedimentisphaerales bacterium]|nr:hypothetical protein [Sedimentisphaerales bacterium]
MKQEHIDRKAYKLAKAYLLNIPGVTADIIEEYINPKSLRPKPKTKNGLYRRILESAQNAGMKPKVIGGAIGGIDKLSLVLYGFNPRKVLRKYDDWKPLFVQIKRQLKPIGKVRGTSRGEWPKYCKTILSAASFVEQFKSAKDFYKWVEFFDKDDRSRASLPMLIDQEIEGIGFALSCDLLKELGYANFPKPDVHLRYIFTKLKLCDNKVNNYQLFKAIVRLAKNAKVSPYNTDKVFWLIGSGKFDNHPEIKIKRRKKEFVKYAYSKLYK